MRSIFRPLCPAPEAPNEASARCVPLWLDPGLRPDAEREGCFDANPEDIASGVPTQGAAPGQGNVAGPGPCRLSRW